MLSKPEHGWVEVKLGNFKGLASYITDIPNDCLDAFIYSLENKVPATMYFDGEGWNFHMLSPWYCPYTYILVEKECLKVHTVEANCEELAKKIVKNIEEHLDDWAKWNVCINKRELAKNKRVLQGKLKKLKRLINR